MRLFVSVDLPDALCEAVADLQAAFADAPGVRPTDPEQAHLTLKFLGETDPGRVDEVTEALEAAVGEAGVAPFEASVEGLGAFPSEEYIRVIWTGIGEGADELTRLHEAVEARAVELGFEPEEHAFTPHVTLGRMEHAGGKDLVQRLLRERDPTLGTMRVGAIRLKESTLGEDGAVHETVAEIPLPASTTSRR